MSSVQHTRDRSARASLRRRAALLATVAACLTLAVAGTFRLAVGAAAAARWLGLAGVVLAAEGLLVGRRLDANRRRDGDALLPRFGLGTDLTLCRGVLLSWLAGFLLLDWTGGALRWVPALLYGAAVVLDYADGTVARRAGRETVLGARLDTSFDALGLLVAPSVAVVAGALPVPYLSVSAARYLFVAGIRLRERRGLPVYDLPPRRSRRALAGLQMAFVAAALSPALAGAPATAGAALFGGAFLLGFVRDWFLVTGRLGPTERTDRDRQPAG
ncbi:CDP-alcohol phosphatidyltransferase family protein [Halegenticoccus tardaugens]|uniref:CDP-alcohol phosphatidyltransferase family protein n=1 Tax=Halegenticoccus tardaugens TaxID=2071624 RepID=UPI00100AE093|nr:CDP-alcohol phosphatidyltransferase family protein [Halegenticoccus tardaugens]